MHGRNEMFYAFAKEAGAVEDVKMVALKAAGTKVTAPIKEQRADVLKAVRGDKLTSSEKTEAMKDLRNSKFSKTAKCGGAIVAKKKTMSK